MNAEVFKQQFFPYQQKLYRIAYRMLQQQANAQDVVQDTYLKLWEKRHEMAQIENKEAFSITILRNLCLDTLRKAKEKVELDIEIPSPQLQDKSMEEKEELNWVWQFIDQLPPLQQQVMILKHWEGLLDEEIELITGLTAVNIRVILSRTRKRIRIEKENMEKR